MSRLILSCSAGTVLGNVKSSFIFWTECVDIGNVDCLCHVDYNKGFANMTLKSTVKVT